MTSLRHRARARRSSGQSLVEFAIAFPIFMLILFGLIDGGRLVYTDATLSQAAREGARVGAVEAGWIGLTSAGCVATPSGITAANPGAHVCPATVAAMKADIVAAVNSMVVGLGKITTSEVDISCNTGQPDDLPPTGNWTEASGGNGCIDGSGNAIATQGDVISVRIAYSFVPITPVLSSIGIVTTRSGAASMVVN